MISTFHKKVRAGMRRIGKWIGRRARRGYRRLFPPPPPARAHFAAMVALAAAEPRAEPAAEARIAFVTPVFDAPPAYLDALVASLRRQRAGAWEAILVDDGSSSPATRAWLDAHAGDGDLTIVRLARNEGVSGATNAGFAAARAPWVAVLDHDDALAPHAVERVEAALTAAPECEFLYTDEVVCDEQLRPEHLFLKPAFDPVLLSGVNYVNHLSLFRRDKAMALGGMRLGFEGSQDYDFLLRYLADVPPERRLHLPYPAYMWRRDGRSLSVRRREAALSVARRALSQAYGGASVDASPLGPELHRVRLEGARDRARLVSVIIPNRDAPDLLRETLRGLNQCTNWPALEIVIQDNGSTDPRTFELYEAAKAGPIPFRVDVEPAPFNFSRAINQGARQSRGEWLLWLNNDVEMRDPGWLGEMAQCLSYPSVGAVGAKLLYPDGSLQHAGVIVGYAGLAGHAWHGQPAGAPGSMGRLWVRHSVSAATGACLLTPRAVFDQVGGLDEINFAIAYNDVDYCLRLREAGWSVVWTPFAELTHHESASRGPDDTPEKLPRFLREQQALRRRHGTVGFQDPARSPWLDADHAGEAPHIPARPPEARSWL